MKKKLLLLLSLIVCGSIPAIEKLSTPELFEKLDSCRRQQSDEVIREYEYCDNKIRLDAEEIAYCKGASHKWILQPPSSECTAIKEELLKRTEKDLKACARNHDFLLGIMRGHCMVWAYSSQDKENVKEKNHQACLLVAEQSDVLKSSQKNCDKIQEQIEAVKI